MADEVNVENVEITETVPEDFEEQDVKLFNKEEEKLPEKKEEKEPPEKKEEEQLPEKKEEVKEEEIEELPELTGHERASFKDINKEYPDFFKKFPQVREALGRENELTRVIDEVSPGANTVDTLHEIIENHKDFNAFENYVMSGDAHAFVDVIKGAGKTNLVDFSMNYLPAIKELSPDLYADMTAPILVEALKSAFVDGSRAGNKNLSEAARWVSQYLFNDPRFASGEVTIPKKEQKKEETSPEAQKLKDRESALDLRLYQEAFRSVDSECSDRFRGAIKNELPDDLSEFMSAHVIEDVLKEVDKILAGDPSHMNRQRALWEAAKKSDFDYTSKARIITSYLTAAKKLMPDVRRKVLSAATKGTNVRTESRREVTGETRTGGSRRRPKSSREVNFKEMSDEDLFSGKYAFKQ